MEGSDNRMAKSQTRINKCYDIIIEILSNDEEYHEKNESWISTDEILTECQKRIKGLKEIEFQSAMEIENDNYSPEVEKYLTKIKYI